MPERPSHTPLGTPFIELQSVDSTNNYALTLVHAGLAQPGTAVFAHQQVAGKGQRGRNWSSEKGKSLSLSLIIDPAPLDTTRQFWLSACVAVTTCGILSRKTGQEFSIKWPNDLYWQDRKAGGILIESIIGNGPSGSATWKWAVAGIGINVNQSSFPDELSHAVSMLQLTGRNLIITDLCREICLELDQAITTMTDEGFSKIFHDFNNLLYKKGEMVRLKKDNRVFTALLKGVSETGELIVEHGIESRYSVGEVQLVPGPVS
ncbi:MAG: biotin--[acetyl-CoA-carboxylase] ligase [Chitinophagaceae bacterium]|nr:MAG: biotin--[acetyl-CoA-carboxylase] ligase [Chitinophagaceae bacterium]